MTAIVEFSVLVQFTPFYFWMIPSNSGITDLKYLVKAIK